MRFGDRIHWEAAHASLLPFDSSSLAYPSAYLRSVQFT
jgi:hypothetical protein